MKRTFKRLIAAAVLALTACNSKPPVKPPPVVDLCAEEGIACSDFFAFDPSAVMLPYTELIQQWRHSKELYIAGRPGLTPDEIARVRAFKLSTLFIVHDHTPTNMRHITATDGHETDIATINAPGTDTQVQGYFTGQPFIMIDYGNPYCLPCEYFHLFELFLRGSEPRSVENRTHEGEAIWEIIGHCTADDPMQACCWRGEAYSVPAGR